MSDLDQPNPAQPPRKRFGFLRIRFSLRTLFLAVLLASGVLAAWLNRMPWQIERTWKVNTSTAPFAAASPNRDWIVAGGVWDPATVLSLETGEVLAQLNHDPATEAPPAQASLIGNPPPQGYSGWAVASPDGSRVALVAGRNRIHIYETRTWKRVRSLSIGDPFVERTPTNLGEAPDLLLAGEPLRLYFWTDCIRCLDADSGKEVRRTETNAFLLDRVVPTPDKRYLLVREPPVWNRVKRLDLELNEIASIETQQAAFTNGITISEDGSVVLTQVNANSASAASPSGWTMDSELRDAETGRVLSRWNETLSVPANLVRSPDGTSMVIITGTYASIRELPSGTELARLGEAYDMGKKICAAHYSPDGTHILTMGGDFAIELWDAQTGEALFRFPHLGQEYRFGQPVFLDDRRILLGVDRRVEIWSRRRPEPWWGMAWRPEVWVSAVLGVAVAWSFARDRRILYRTISR